MQSLDPTVYQKLRQIASVRGISLQELIRAIVVPEWMRISGEGPVRKAPVDSQTLQKYDESSKALPAGSKQTSRPINSGLTPSNYKAY
jgi:hypothetical protein